MWPKTDQIVVFGAKEPGIALTIRNIPGQQQETDTNLHQLSFKQLQGFFTHAIMNKIGFRRCL
jgi:hypothetical protein